MSQAVGREHTNALVIELQLGRLMVLRSNSAEGHAHIAHAANGLLAREAELDPRTLFVVASTLGEAALYDGRLTDAEPHLRRALVLSQQLRSQLPDDGVPEAQMAWYLQDTGQYEEARRVLSHVQSRLTATLPLDHPTLAYLAEALAGVALAEGDLAHAWALLSKAQGSQDERESQFGSYKHSLGRAEAVVLIARGDAAQAQPTVLAQYQAMRSTPATEQYLSTRFAATEQVGRLYSALGRCDQALPYFEEALALMAGGSALNPRLALTRARYGQCLLQQGRPGSAREQAQWVKRALEANGPLSHQLRQPSLGFLADMGKAPAGSGVTPKM
jgi:tetratricopeptide (TPR) repeat protein